ncbi:MAG: hypothetical protein AB7E37_06025, partial [Candidatus Altimarinota bacterium]
EQVPDWLKGSMGTAEIKSEETVLEVSPEVETKVEEEQVPDWLKGVVSEENIAGIPEPEAKKTPKSKKGNEIQEVSQKEEKPKKSSSPSTKAKKDEKNETSNQELWDDGMAIPDWLKEPTVGEKTPTKKTTQSKKTDDFWTLDEPNSDDDKAKKE